MTKKDFDERIAEIERRLAILRQGREGAIDYRRVRVKQHIVPSYTVRAHTRLVPMLKRAPVATKGTRP